MRLIETFPPPGVLEAVDDPVPTPAAAEVVPSTVEGRVLSGAFAADLFVDADTKDERTLD